MKNSLIVFALLMFTACGNPIVSNTNDFIESEYVPTLKDPTSYVKISTEIISVEYDNKGLPNRYIIEHKYKALNGFGLLAPDNLRITYFPNSNTHLISLTIR